MHQIRSYCTCLWFDFSFPSLSREEAEGGPLVLGGRWRLVGLWGRFCCFGRGWLQEGGLSTPLTVPTSPGGVDTKLFTWRNKKRRCQVTEIIQRSHTGSSVKYLSSNTSVVCSICWYSRLVLCGSDPNCFCECSIKFSSELSLRFLSTCRDRCRL